MVLDVADVMDAGISALLQNHMLKREAKKPSDMPPIFVRQRSEKIGCSQDSSYIELRRPHASSCSSEALAKAVRLCLLDDTARILAAVSP